MTLKVLKKRKFKKSKILVVYTNAGSMLQNSYAKEVIIEERPAECTEISVVKGILYIKLCIIQHNVSLRRDYGLSCKLSYTTFKMTFTTSRLRLCLQFNTCITIHGVMVNTDRISL